MQENVSESVFRKAEDLFRQGSYTESFQILRDLDRKYPDQKNILNALAMVRMKLGHWDDCRRIATRLRDELGDPRGVRILAELESASNTIANQSHVSLVDDVSAHREFAPLDHFSSSLSDDRRGYNLTLLFRTAVVVCVVFALVYWIIKEDFYYKTYAHEGYSELYDVDIISSRTGSVATIIYPHERIRQLAEAERSHAQFKREERDREAGVTYRTITQEYVLGFREAYRQTTAESGLSRLPANAGGNVRAQIYDKSTSQWRDLSPGELAARESPPFRLPASVAITENEVSYDVSFHVTPYTTPDPIPHTVTATRPIESGDQQKEIKVKWLNGKVAEVTSGGKRIKKK